MKTVQQLRASDPASVRFQGQAARLDDVVSLLLGERSA
jgi:hypothetical protein